MRVRVWLIFAIVLGFGSPARGDDTPPVFSGRTFADALAANRTNGTFLIVKFTAEWCSPCKLMDKTTWRQDGVVAWVKEHGEAIEVDVDRNVETAQEHRASFLPTTIAFKDGKEVDRATGYREAAQLLEWLRGVQTGETSSARLRRRLEDVRSGRVVPSPHERLALASDLLEGEQYDEATREYVWLWDNIAKDDASLTLVRETTLVSHLARLCAVHEPAKATFVTLRDALEARLRDEATRTWEALGDWLALNDAVGDGERSLAWFDRRKADHDASATFSRFAPRLNALLSSFGEDRYAETLYIYRDPLKKLREEHQAVRDFWKDAPPPEDAAATNSYGAAWNVLARKLGLLYSKLVELNRLDEAAKFADEAIGLDNSWMLITTMVATSLEKGHSCADMRRLLKMAKEFGQDTSSLDARLEELLKKQSPK